MHDFVVWVPIVVWAVGLVFFAIKNVINSLTQNEKYVFKKIFKNICGLILLKNPLLYRSMDSIDLFFRLNKQKPLHNMQQLNKVYENAKNFVKLNSYYVNHDLKLLTFHYNIVKNHIEYEELKAYFRNFNNNKNSFNTKSNVNWRSILKVSSTESNVLVIKKSFRKLSMVHHPDRGGSNEKMQELVLAMTEARKELNFV